MPADEARDGPRVAPSATGRGDPFGIGELVAAELEELRVGDGVDPAGQNDETLPTTSSIDRAHAR
jgi:hypothetical protein